MIPAEATALTQPEAAVSPTGHAATRMRFPSGAFWALETIVVPVIPVVLSFVARVIHFGFEFDFWEIVWDSLWGPEVPLVAIIVLANTVVLLIQVLQFTPKDTPEVHNKVGSILIVAVLLGASTFGLLWGYYATPHPRPKWAKIWAISQLTLAFGSVALGLVTRSIARPLLRWKSTSVLAPKKG